MDAPRLARYPFVPEAVTLVQEEGPPLGRLLEAKAWSSARSQGKQRVLAALDGDPAPASHASSGHEALVDVLGYVVGRLIVSAIDERLLVNRFATAESRRLAEALTDEPDPILFEVCQALEVPVEHRDGDEPVYAVPFEAYLTTSRELSAIEWKLVNRTMDAGQVLLAREQVIRLAQEGLKLKLASELPLELPSDVVDAIEPLTRAVESKLADLRSGRAELDFEEIKPERFPPCMNGIINAIHAGENVSHEGRFAIVAFLHTIGMDRDGIINELFPNVPDFAKEVTEYQVDHITGAKNKEAYTPPGCSSLQTYGLCPMLERSPEDWDDWCAHDKMNHPLTYYRWGLYVDEKRGEGSSGDEGDEAGEDAGDAPDGEEADDDA